MDRNSTSQTHKEEYKKAQEIHEISQRSFGLSKRYSFLAHTFEFLVVIIPLWIGTDVSRVTLTAIVLGFVAFGLRRVSKKLRSLAETAKRISFSSHIESRDSTEDELLRVNLMYGLPETFLGKEWAAKILMIDKKKELTDFYYTADQERDLDYKRLNYSQNSFWSCKLFGYSSVMYLLVFFFTLAISAFLIDGLATSNSQPDSTLKFLEFIYAALLGWICLRSLSAFFDAYDTWKDLKVISEQLSSQKMIRKQTVTDLCEDYNRFVSLGPLVPDFLYSLSKKNLNSEWSKIKDKIGEVENDPAAE